MQCLFFVDAGLDIEVDRVRHARNIAIARVVLVIEVNIDVVKIMTTNTVVNIGAVETFGGIAFFHLSKRSKQAVR
jgi:hypothetical protein